MLTREEAARSADWITAGSPDPFSNYLMAFPSGVNVLQQSDVAQTEGRDARVAEDARRFVAEFQAVIQQYRHSLGNAHSFPPLRFDWLDDGSLLIEWIFRDFRAGFALEVDQSQSSWYLVSNRNLGEQNISGLLEMKVLFPLLAAVVDYAASNS